MEVVVHAERLPQVMPERHNSKWGTQSPKAVRRKYAVRMQKSSLSLAD